MRKVLDKEIQCDRCGSSDTVRHGYKKTIKRGNQQRYFCKECAHTFYNMEDK
jgi:transposase-like protein